MAADSLINGTGAEDIWRLITPTSVVALSVALAAAWFFCPLLQSNKSSRPAESTAGGSQPKSRAGEMPKGPNLQGTFIPSTGLVEGNTQHPAEFENDNCSGLLLALHRPTWNKALDKSCDYPYGDHFKGRKRLWEIRLQFRFKQDVQKPMRFGIELEDYVPMNAASKKLMGLTVSALRQVAGNDLYHSPGDDPRKTPEPHEKPVFSMPLWACDQFVVTPEDEQPPDLTDPAFSEFGTKRVDDRAAFMAEMSALELRTGPTYTFAFWGISQFLDDIKWEVTKVIPFKNIDFNTFCGRPPVHVVMYTLKDSDDDERRHLQSRKDYYFRLAFWSSRKPPSQDKMRTLLPKDDSKSLESGTGAKKRKGWSQRISGMFACCAEQRPA
mmetsp:Transcript_62219/g.157173  ORF Transcript_62219/g.157173 Transcript_62219/m.157173 type:complete len:382 (+) Transcript_62219:96-1241(+)